MGIIRQLPPSVVNQIAAGEVVERPASVVKELLENAIDAKATRIDLSVERGGKDLVRVADNGIGMAPDDLLLAFQPHATSKLADADDLHRIRTLGFRGEALAAIAEVSKVRCQTRRFGADEGSELCIEGGTFGPLKSCGGPVGTVMEVRNLFYNTPVRRTFLKSDMTEAGHVVEMFSRIALANPEIHLTYRSGGKIIHDLPPVAGLRERIAVFFGRELAESLLWVEGRLDEMHLWGYVAHPSQSRSTAKGQYLFLGGRYVRDRSLTHALNEAYRGLLMVGRLPVAFLHLDIPPEEVDVNVHPTKVEVRFRDSNRIYSHLLATLRQTFLKSDLHARLQPTGDPEPVPEAAAVVSGPIGGAAPAAGLTGGPIDRQAVASWFEPSRPRAEIPGAAPAWAQSLPGAEFDEFSTAASGPGTAPVPVPPIAPREDHVAGDRGLSASSGAPMPAPPSAPGVPAAIADLGPRLRAIQVHDSYLIAETGDGMVVIDQHALHERILYEELRARVAQGQVESQRLLVPEPVDLPAAEAAAVLEQTDVLARLGLEVEAFGGDTVLVRSLPAMLPHVEPGRLVRDLAEHLRTQYLPPTRDGLLAELLHMVACKAAIKAGQPLTPAEIDALLERRHLVADSHHCPHGRPTALVFTRADLEKQFGRI
jgi:DNA mismatch repair protein MutL